MGSLQVDDQMIAQIDTVIDGCHRRDDAFAERDHTIGNHFAVANMNNGTDNCDRLTLVGSGLWHQSECRCTEYNYNKSGRQSPQAGEQNFHMLLHA